MSTSVALVYPPPSTPTCPPLGLACLSSYLKAHNPGINLKIHDLNIDLYHKLSGSQPEYIGLKAFLTGVEDNFFNQELYLQKRGALLNLSYDVGAFADYCRSYLETNNVNTFFNSILNMYCFSLSEGSPGFIGFSVIYSPQLYPALVMAKKIASQPQSYGFSKRPVIVFGGATMSALDISALLQVCPWVDFVCEGEGEECFDLLIRGVDPSHIPGLCFQKEGQIIITCQKEPMALSNIPLPDFSSLPMYKYLEPRVVLPVQFSRNCAWGRCRFCKHNHSFNCYRKKDTEAFIDELEALQQKLGLNHFYMVDQQITPSGLKEISTQILKRKLHINFHIMARPIKAFSSELLNLASSAGCRWISWGMETGSQRLLNICDKGTNTKHFSEVLKNSKMAGISNLVMLIFGLPTSQPEDLQATLDLFADLKDYADAYTTSAFQLFDGTPFASNPRKFGLKIQEQELILSLSEGVVKCDRLKYGHLQNLNSFNSSLASWEIQQWKNKYQWISRNTIFEKACTAEYYLLFASHITPLADEIQVKL